MELELTTLLLLMLAALIAGFIDAIAGGGGLITIPALLATGMPPALALGTNKLQSCFGSLTATLYFRRQGLIQIRRLWPHIVCTFCGSAAGTLLVQHVDPTLLSKVLPFLLIGFSIYFLFSPRISNQDGAQRLTPIAFAFLIGTSIGFYDGFFGPGTGSFFAIAFVALAGFGLAKATAHTKLLNFTSNIASLLFFAMGGHVLWSAGFAMAVGQYIGARVGSRMVISHGVTLIKPLLVGISLLISFRLIWQHYT